MNGQENQVLDEVYKEEVSQKLDEFRKSDLLCDVNVRAKGQDFPAHRCVLSAGSPYFRALFTSELKVRESENNLIQLTEVTCDALTEVLQFIYTGKAKINSSNAEDLVIAADYLIIAILAVTSPIVINVPTRGLLAVETKDSFVLWLAKFKYQKNCL